MPLLLVSTVLLAKIPVRTFSTFMGVVVESVSNVVIYTGAQQARSEKLRNKDKSFIYVHSEDSSSSTAAGENCEVDKPYLFCEQVGHRLKNCSKFQQLSIDDQWKNIQRLKLCRSSLNPRGRLFCRVSIQPMWK